MLNNIRNFSKTFLAKILLVIIIIPFIFWGMGNVFNTGNTNNIVKINKNNISTKDFMNFINRSNLTPEIIKENIDNNIIEEILSKLISKTMLEMEIDDLNLTLSDESLVKRIKNNKNFFDENNKFSRIKYEKFLLSNNLTAVDFEKQLKENELKNRLFTYVSGGVKSPYFLVNDSFKSQKSKLYVDYINLDNSYKKEKDFSNEEIKNYINENKNDLKIDIIDFSYIKITPNNLIGVDDFNELYFEKIDELENKISNGESFENITNDLKITPVKEINYSLKEESNESVKIIFNNRKAKDIQLIDKNEFYLLFKIDKIINKLPSITNQKFKKRVSQALYSRNVFEFNQSLFKKIIKKEFSRVDFDKIAKGKEEKIELTSNKDFSKFNEDSIINLYSLPVKSFALISDNENNVYLANIRNIKNTNINKNSNEYMNYVNAANITQKKDINSSFDFYLNNKYEIKVNQQTLTRVKNYFK